MEQVTTSLVVESYRRDPAAAREALAETDLSDEEVQHTLDEFLDGLERGRLGIEFPKNAMLRALLEGSFNAAWTMFVLDWTVVRLDDGGDDFVLADNPVSLYDPRPAFPGGGTGLLSSEWVQVFLPLSPRTGLVLEPSKETYAWTRENYDTLSQMPAEDRLALLAEREGGWAEGVATAEFGRDLNLRTYATADRYIFGSQIAVQRVHALRRTHRPRLAELAPRGPRVHLVEDADEGSGNLQITKTFRALASRSQHSPGLHVDGGRFCPSTTRRHSQGATEGLELRGRLERPLRTYSDDHCGSRWVGEAAEAALPLTAPVPLQGRSLRDRSPMARAACRACSASSRRRPRSRCRTDLRPWQRARRRGRRRANRPARRLRPCRPSAHADTPGRRRARGGRGEG
jgi:Protein of unknown function (DUF4238)